MEWKDVHPNMFATIVSLDWQWQQGCRCQWLLQNMREKNFWFSFSNFFVVVLLIFLHLHLILRLWHSSYKHKTKRWRHLAFTFFCIKFFFFSQTPQKNPHTHTNTHKNKKYLKRNSVKKKSHCNFFFVLGDEKTKHTQKMAMARAWVLQSTQDKKNTN